MPRGLEPQSIRCSRCGQSRLSLRLVGGVSKPVFPQRRNSHHAMLSAPLLGNIEAIFDITIRQLLLDRLSEGVGYLPKLSLAAGFYVGSVLLPNSMNAVQV